MLPDLIYNPVAQGVSYGYSIVSDEDKKFTEGAQTTQWQPSFETSLPSKFVNINYDFMNEGCGKTMYATLLKSIDYLWKSYIVMYRPAIAPKADSGVLDCSYTNAFAFHVIRSICFKISTQTLFSMDGFVMFLLCDMFGLLSKYAELIGYCKTRKELISRSHKDAYLAAPLIGFPFQETSDKAYNAGSITFFEIKCKVDTRPISELYINYGIGENVPEAIPRLIKTGEKLTGESIKFQLSSNNVWVRKAERDNLLDYPHELMYTEHLLAGEAEIAQGGKKFAFPIDMKGPVTWVAAFVQDNRNLANKNWTSGANVEGEEILTQFNISMGSGPFQDGLPAVMQRVAKNIELFGNEPSGALYVINFAADGRKISTFMNTTNAEKLQAIGTLNPSAHQGCKVTIIYGTINGVWSEGGNGGALWQ